MKKAIKILLLLSFIIVYDASYAQLHTDSKLIFKMWLFLDHQNSLSRYNKEYLTKDSSLFSLFERGIDLHFDTLKTNGFGSGYTFLSVVAYKSNKPFNQNAIAYKVKKEIEYMDIPVNNCEGYTLCINNNNGKSYRIQGFNGCDLLSLIREIQVQYLGEMKKKLSDKQFLNNYNVSGVDLSCLYNALKSGSDNWDKYLCIRPCEDIQVIVH